MTPMTRQQAIDATILKLAGRLSFSQQVLELGKLYDVAYVNGATDLTGTASVRPAHPLKPHGVAS